MTSVPPSPETPGPFAAFGVVVRRDLTLAWRRRAQIVNPLVFFLIVVTLFPLALGPETNLLARMAPGIIWVAALLASMLSLEQIFHADFDDGTLEQMLLSPQPTVVIVTAKVAAHWLVAGLPLVLLAPLLGVLLHVPETVMPVLLAGLALGTPVLSLVGAVGAALTVTQRGGGVLLSVLVLPLFAPALILGAAAADSAAGGLPAESHLYLLAALLVLTATLAPWAIGAAVRIAFE